MASLDSFKARKKLVVGAKTYYYYSLKAAEKNGLTGISRLPYSLKVLLENLLRHEDGRTVTKENIKAFAGWLTQKGKAEVEIAFRPARVLMQDFTGVPAVVDLAAMRDAFVALGGDPQKINPLVPVDLVIDHSVMVDQFGDEQGLEARMSISNIERNGERYRFLKWGQTAFDNFRVVPPGTGICHQVNLEYLAQTVWTKKEKIKVKGKTQTSRSPIPTRWSAPTSHTTMVNGLAVLGWGVGGIEAEAAMLGQPLSMLLPEVIGFKLERPAARRRHRDRPRADGHADVAQKGRRRKIRRVLRRWPRSPLARRSRDHRQYGAGIWRDLRLFPDRCGDACDYLTHFGPQLRPRCAGRGICTRRKGMLRDGESARSGVHRHFDARSRKRRAFARGSEAAGRTRRAGGYRARHSRPRSPMNIKKAGAARSAFPGQDANFDLGHGDVVIAAITSCTNTSNPGVLIGAGLLARNAVERGLKVKPWVKTSLAPGSQVVARISRQIRAAKVDSTSLASISSALAAPPASAIRGRCRRRSSKADQRARPRRRRGPVGQSQFRRPRESRRAGELSRLAAAGGGLCARGNNGD